MFFTLARIVIKPWRTILLNFLPKAEWNQKAVLCGACGYEMSVEEYLASGHSCPGCSAAFNPGCRKHAHFYFESVDRGEAGFNERGRALQ